MHIPRTTAATPSLGAQGVSFPTTSGGSTPGMMEGLRADWNVRMNLSHAQGFVGGAARLLIHNQTADERTELTLYLPAARPNQAGTLELQSAVVCSAKPGLPAQAGQALVISPQGPKVTVTLPVLKLNDWIYVDLQWSGSFPAEGVSFPNAIIPVGEFHPQVAVELTGEDGLTRLYPVGARYEVVLGTDHGATVRLEGEGGTGIVSHPNADGSMTEHEFKSQGAPGIAAQVVPPGSVG